MFLVSFLMLDEYPQDSILKLSRNDRPSVTIYQGMVIVPYVKDISEKFRYVGNCFNVRTIKTKHTLHRIWLKTGPIIDAQQTKQCV
jgi:ABC-type microcin C transport system permease subunit YejE